MYLIQGRKKFSTLEEAKENLDPEGGRIAIIGEERVATIRPQIVHNFPGTLEQLYELGLKLGGYPSEVYLKNKKHFDEQDLMKEMIFARTLAYLDWLWEKKYETILNDLISYLARIVKQSNLSKELNQYETVEQLLDAFKTNALREGKYVVVPAAEAMKEVINHEIKAQIGWALVEHLSSVAKNELDSFINDPYSPYFKEVSVSGMPKTEKIYITLRKHPDIQKVFNDYARRIEQDLLQSKPTFLLQDQKSELIFARRESQVNDLFGESEEVISGNIFAHLSEQQKQTLLTLYFAKFNPIKLIHEAMVSASFGEHLLSEHESEIGEEMKEHIGYFLKELGDLQKLENIFLSHPLFAVEMMHDFIAKHFDGDTSDVDEENDLFDLDDEDEEDDFDFDQLVMDEYKSNFNEHILRNTRLSWREKGLLAYAFFVSDGYIDMDEIEEVSLHSKQTVRKSLKRLEELGVISYEMDFGGLYSINLEGLDDWSFVDDPYKSFFDFLTDDRLSWEAKGVNIWFEINGTEDPEDLVEWSTDKITAVKKIYKELHETGLIMSREDLLNIEDLYEEKVQMAKDRLKERVRTWYEEHLKHSLLVLLQSQTPSPALLNAKLPEQENMMAIQIATIAGDTEAVGKLLKIEGITLPLEVDFEDMEDMHPFLLALEMDIREMLPILLDSPAVTESESIIADALDHHIRRKGSIPCLQEAIQHLGGLENKQALLDWLLVTCLIEMEPGYAEVLLEAGASPEAPVIHEDESAMNIAQEHNIKEFIELFERYKEI